MTEQIALVTGASRGLGFATAQELAARGWHVVALARTVGGLEELADAIDAGKRGSCTLVPLDITDDPGLQRMARAIHDRWGRLDLLVHCAAQDAPCAPAGHVAEKDLDKAFAVNARATQRLIVMCDPLLKASDHGVAIYPVDPDPQGGKFFSAYGASKAAATAMMQSWASESARIGPRVALFAPQPMPTALRARFYPGEDRAALTPCSAEAVRMLALLAHQASVTAG